MKCGNNRQRGTGECPNVIGEIINKEGEGVPAWDTGVMDKETRWPECDSGLIDKEGQGAAWDAGMMDKDAREWTILWKSTFYGLGDVTKFSGSSKGRLSVKLSKR